ncbi:MAG TPA: putative Na+/H+ antiporter [Vicinamibacterales bacterium]|nr:putative Na+/H+ antiporter [Vicinamibacterales bacterium]
MSIAPVPGSFPRPLDSYPPPPDPSSLLSTLASRVETDPFNAVATAIFLLAIVHTFAAGRFARLSHQVQHRHDERARARGERPRPSVLAELLHFVGEVEVVFGLWAVVLFAAIALSMGWETAKGYFNGTVNYTEPLFVVVIMALASTRPVVVFAEGALRRLADAGGGTPAAWWVSILTIGPLLGSFITEPAAMTICALLLGRQFYDREPSAALKYATLGLLFVNVSIGGTLTHFAAPPVLMVARPFSWDTPYMLLHFGWRAALAIAVSTLACYLLFRKELSRLASSPSPDEVEQPDDAAAPGEALLPVPAWVTVVHLGFIGWTVLTAHYPALFIGGFLFFVGFALATPMYQQRLELRTPLLVGFFLGGLVIHGGLQGWWIAPVLGSLTAFPLFAGSMVLTAFNDNALITYLATLVPNLGEELRLAVVQGAVVGGGLTVIANAPNPAGQALLRRFFGGAVSPLGLLAGAIGPTLLTAAIFRLF